MSLPPTALSTSQIVPPGPQASNSDLLLKTSDCQWCSNESIVTGVWDVILVVTHLWDFLFIFLCQCHRCLVFWELFRCLNFVGMLKEQLFGAFKPLFMIKKVFVSAL